MTVKPAHRIRWRTVTSSNVIAVGWDNLGNMYVRFRGIPPTVYLYKGVSRQRAVAASRAASVGRYINKIIKPQFPAVKIR